MDQYEPVWLDKSFLTTVLQEVSDNEDVTVAEFAVKPAVKGVDSIILNNIYRVRVEYEVEGEQETISLVLKVLKGFSSDSADSSDFFCKEHMMYSRVLADLNDKVSCEFGPAVYPSPVKSCLVLEDLREDGYVMCDEFKQLDLDHCRKVVETLAKFHASSVACYHENPRLIEAVGEDILWADSCVLKPWVKSAVRTMLRIVNVMEGCEEFSELLNNRVDLLWESVLRISKPKESGLNVLNHGDLWANNMLFKYDDVGSVDDVKFLDFQITKFATPALDLINFIWTSGNEEVRECGQPELYQTYLMTLNTTLEQLGCEERLTEKELREDLQMASDWGILMICCALPVIMSSPEDTPNLGSFSSEDFGTTKFKRIYSGKRFRYLLPTVIKQFTDFLGGQSF